MCPNEQRAAVLIVCTGNICRSPMAEHLLRSGLGDMVGEAAGEVAIMSAGVRGIDGVAMVSHAAQVLMELGVDSSNFVGRKLTADLISQADLVLCAAREQRSAVVTLVPKALRRTFTLREFARLLADVSVEEIVGGSLADRIQALAQAANRQRGHVPSAPPGSDNINDPFGKSIKAFRECAEEVMKCLDVMLRLLATAGRPPTGSLCTPTDEDG